MNYDLHPMHLKYFGDSYDIGKQALLSWLRPFGKWSVDPMFDDPPNDAVLLAFERFLRVEIVQTNVLRRDTDRRQYFAAVEGCENLFLDPTTGLRVGAGNRPEYLYSSELLRLVECRTKWLTLVFDQSLARGKERAGVERKIEHLRSQGVLSFAYCSHACFIVAGHNDRLVDRAYRQLLQESGLPETRFVRGCM